MTILVGWQNRIVNLHCNTITMPGHDLEQQTQRLGSEPATEIVQGHEYAGNITATFYLDASLETKSWFDEMARRCRLTAPHIRQIITKITLERWRYIN